MRKEDFTPMGVGGDTIEHRSQLAMACPQGMVFVSLLLFVVVAVFTQHETAPNRQGIQGSIKKVKPPLRNRDEGLGIAWLMSFPNSGTSFTSKLIRHVTALSTATNYGEEAGGGSSIFGSDQPPFWLDPHSISDYSRPTNLVLTKTHCGGRCELCGPKTYIESPHSFLMQCLSGRGVGNSTKGTKQISDVIGYEKSLVRKAVHLIRNPFDNVVSRFHLELHTFAKEKVHNHRNDPGSMLNYTEDSKGFRSFCSMLDQTYHNEEKHSRWMDATAMSIMKDVPCRADIVRYVQWHNLAFVVTRDLGIPTMVLHYEDYRTKFDKTLDELVSFLETDIKGKAVDFVAGKSYAKDYFTAEERVAIRDGVKQLAMQDTWNSIQHYFKEEI